MADDTLEIVEQEVLEALKAEARKQFLLIERCATIIRTINLEINKPSETPAMDRWYTLLERVKKVKAAAEIKYAELRLKITRIINSGGTVPPPGGGGGTGGGSTLPPPPEGVVKLADLERLFSVAPPNKIFSSWGTHVVYPEMIDQHHMVPNPPGTHALIHQGGTGAGGVQAVRSEPLLLSKCWLEGTGAPGYGPHTRWNCRAYGAADWTFDKCYAFNNPDEHAYYLNSIWNIAWKKCLFKDIGSQGIQVVWREGEAVNFEDYKDPYGDGRRAQMLVDECGFVEVGRPDGGRPSYAISFFELQPWVAHKECDVIIQGTYMESKDFENYEKSGGPYYSYGAIMVHGHRDVIIRKNAIRYRKPNRDLIAIWNCDNVIIEDNEIGDPWDNSNVVIDIRNCNKVTIKGNTGNAIVAIAKNMPVYSWENLKYDYVGPIAADTTL